MNRKCLGGWWRYLCGWSTDREHMLTHTHTHTHRCCVSMATGSPRITHVPFISVTHTHTLILTTLTNHTLSLTHSMNEFLSQETWTHLSHREREREREWDRKREREREREWSVVLCERPERDKRGEFSHWQFFCCVTGKKVIYGFLHEDFIK